MSLDKSINYGKEHRRAYRGAKSVNKSCRNHGTCKRCRYNRLHKFKKYNNATNESFIFGLDEFKK